MSDTGFTSVGHRSDAWHPLPHCIWLAHPLQCQALATTPDDLPDELCTIFRMPLAFQWLPSCRSTCQGTAKTMQVGAGLCSESPASSTISCAIQTRYRERLQVELGLQSPPVSVVRDGARTGHPAAAQSGLSSGARDSG